MNSIITGIGVYTPEKTLTNHDLEKIVETSDEWITRRTGIRKRHIANGESTVAMAELGAADLCKRYDKDLSDVDFIIFASSTAEHKIPSLASQLQTNLEIRQAGSMDLTAACAGFVYGIIIAQSLIRSQTCKKILVAASEVLSRHTDYKDRTTCILFGDAASVVLLEASHEAKMYTPVFGTEGEYGHILYISESAGIMNSQPVQNHNMIVQDGKKVFKWAVERMSKKYNELLELNDLDNGDIDFLVPHSANLRIIEAICSNVGLKTDRALQSVTEYGNTSAVSIPLAIDKGIKDGLVHPGNKLALLGFGGGLTYSGTIIDWKI